MRQVARGSDTGKPGQIRMDVVMHAIKDWNEVFENYRTREVGELSYVMWPLRRRGEAFLSLMASPEGLQAFGVFALLVQIVAGCPKPYRLRGELCDDRGPVTPERVAAKMGAPVELVAKAFARLLSPEVGWLVEVGNGSPPTKHRSTTDEAPTGHRRFLSKSSNEQSPYSGSSKKQAAKDVSLSREPARGAQRTVEIAADDSGRKRICSLLLGVHFMGAPVLDSNTAAAIAKHPKATIEQVTWAIERFSEMRSTERGRAAIKNAAAYLRGLVQDKEPPAGWATRFRRIQLAELAQRERADAAAEKGSAE